MGHKEDEMTPSRHEDYKRLADTKLDGTVGNGSEQKRHGYIEGTQDGDFRDDSDGTYDIAGRIVNTIGFRKGFHRERCATSFLPHRR
jgi:hypothetical protein